MLKSYKRQQIAGFFLLGVLIIWLGAAPRADGISLKVVVIVSIHISGFALSFISPLNKYDTYLISATLLLVGGIIIMILGAVLGWAFICLAEIGTIILAVIYGGAGYRLFGLGMEKSLFHEG